MLFFFLYFCFFYWFLSMVKWVILSSFLLLPIVRLMFDGLDGWFLLYDLNDYWFYQIHLVDANLIVSNSCDEFLVNNVLDWLLMVLIWGFKKSSMDEFIFTWFMLLCLNYRVYVCIIAWSRWATSWCCWCCCRSVFLFFC